MAQNDDRFLGLMARWLVALRKRLAMTQVELAKYLGIYSEAISRWENAVQAPSAPNLLRIMALATPDEREALIEKTLYGVDNALMVDTRSGLEPVLCDQCSLPLWISDFAVAGWPVPPIIRKLEDRYSPRACLRCQAY